MKKCIQTNAAPAAIGTYSQAIHVGNTVYLSGQIPLLPDTMTLVVGDVTVQAQQVFENMRAVAVAAGGSLDAIVKLTVYLKDIAHLANVNQVMEQYFTAPYPARTTIAVAGLPKNALIEVEAIMVI